MSMSRDLKLYLLLVCIPAVCLAGLGIVYLVRQAEASDARDAAMRAARIENLSAAVQDAVIEAGRTDDAVQTVLRGWSGGTGVRPPAGAFIWDPKERLRWTEGVVVTNLVDFTRWNEWTAIGKKRARRGLMKVDAASPLFVLWGRVDASVYGVVFDGEPLVEEGATINVWFVGCILVLLLGGVVIAGAGLMARAAAKARLDDRTKTTFLSNVTHELKTPLAGIGIWAELLVGGRLKTEEDRLRGGTMIRNENARMLRLVENLLDYARLEQGRRRYCIETVDVVAITADVVDLLREKFSDQGIELKVGTACEACADADAVRQILVNLLGNAAKYAAAAGPVEVDVTKEDGVVRVAVLDRGPGIPPEAMRHVFDRFYRVDDTLTAKQGGLGLGLAISRALAVDMKGSVTVAARPGGGCVFTLELPGCAS